MAGENSLSQVLVSPMTQAAVRSSMYGSTTHFADQIAKAANYHYGQSPSGDSKLVVSNNPGAITIVAPEGRPEGPVVVPKKMSHPAEFKMTLDTRHLWQSASDDTTAVKALIFDQGRYYKNKVNTTLEGISSDVKILIEGSEALYKESFLDRLCNQTIYLIGIKFALAESRRQIDKGQNGTLAQFNANFETYYANEKRVERGMLQMDPMEDPYKTHGNIGFLELVGGQKVINRHTAWVPELYAGQLIHMYLMVAAIEFGN